MSDRYLVISSDCHAGLRPEAYRDYLDPQYREAFDAALPIQAAAMEESGKRFLVDDINEQWRRGNENLLHGAWDHDARLRVLDGDGIAGEIIFPDGITEMNSPPFGASLGLPTEGVDPEMQWAGARAHNRWLSELVSMAPDRHFGVAVIPYELVEADLNAGRLELIKTDIVMPQLTFCASWLESPDTLATELVVDIASRVTANRTAFAPG